MSDKLARQAIAVAREWQENDEVTIDPEIVENLIDELEARLPPATQAATAGGE